MKQKGFWKQLRVAFRIIGIGILCLIPTPTYGNHGGFYKESKEKPIDDMDKAFYQHDRALEFYYEYWQNGIKSANRILLEKLYKIKKLPSLYGRFYMVMSKIIFKIGS
jgi:hypothetical protein